MWKQLRHRVKRAEHRFISNQSQYLLPQTLGGYRIQTISRDLEARTMAGICHQSQEPFLPTIRSLAKPTQRHRTRVENQSLPPLKHLMEIIYSDKI